MPAQIFPSAREIVTQSAAAANMQVSTSDAGHYSVGYIPARVVDGNPSGAVTQGFAVIDARTIVNFFNYGINQALTNSNNSGPVITASRATTSLEKGYELPPDEMMAIERISLCPMSPLVHYSAVQLSSADQVVQSAWLNGGTGHVHVADPLGMMCPADLTIGPLTLHHAAWQEISNAAVLELYRGAGTTGGRMLGHATRYASSNAPYLLAGRIGNDGHSMDEGIVWDRGTGVDSKLSFRLTIEEPIVIPFAIPTTVPGGTTRLGLPNAIVFPVRMVVDGLRVTLGRSLNAS